MGTGTVVGATKLVDHGPDDSRWNLVLVGDGYTAGAQQGWFSSTVGSFVARMQTIHPFTAGTLTWDRINVHRVDVESDETGAINPEVCPDGTTPFGGSASNGVSYFDAEYCPVDIRRGLVVDSVKVMNEVGALIPDWDAILVFVNHVEPGGTGGAVGVLYAGGWTDDTAIHELGHTAFGLADEYDYRQGCDSGETGRDTYTGLEPVAPNITIDTSRTAIKWSQYVDPSTPMPTTLNPDPALCDTQPSPVGPGVTGAFDGAGQYHSGLFRPEYTCMMRHSGDAFCRVCTDVIIGTIVIEESDCFLVTAVYGDDPWAPDVVALREWRDRHLRPGARGRRVMRILAALYRRTSPTLASIVRERPALARLLRRWVFGPWARRVQE